MLGDGDGPAQRPRRGTGTKPRGIQAAYDNGYRAGYDQGQADTRGRDRYGSTATAAIVMATTATTRATATATAIARRSGRGYSRIRAGLRRLRRLRQRAGPPRRDPGYGSRYPTYPNSGARIWRLRRIRRRLLQRSLRSRLARGDQKGREDAKDGDRYDPRRHNWYRDGDRGYNSRYG